MLLYVFDNFDSATRFARVGIQHGLNKEKIFKAEVINPRKIKRLCNCFYSVNEFWWLKSMHKKHTVLTLMFPPPGTMQCHAVKLIEEIKFE